MNSAQKRKQKRYTTKLINDFCIGIIEILENIKSGKSTVEDEIKKAEEIKEFLKDL